MSEISCFHIPIFEFEDDYEYYNNSRASVFHSTAN
jgi:hypothetical protein